MPRTARRYQGDDDTYLKSGPSPRLDLSRRQRIARTPVSPLQLDIAVHGTVRLLNLYSVAR
jgi:hypothetical protein